MPLQDKEFLPRCPEGTALNSTKEFFAQGVTLNTLVSNARVHIGQINVIFVAHQENHSQVLPPPVLPSPRLPTPVKIKPLIELLSGYEPSIIQFLISGFSHGFPLHYKGEHRVFEARNLLSALQNPEIVDMKLGKELAAARLAGPFVSPPFLSFYVSPIAGYSSFVFSKRSIGQ